MTAIVDAEPVVLSICIPTFNRARYLENLLVDLANNMDRLGCTLEILIGDNFSDDDSPEVAKSHAARLPIRYFRRSENIGAMNNLNLLYEAASGRYCVYLADDDFLIVDNLREIIQFLECNPHIGAVQAPWLNHDRVTGQDFEPFYSLERNIIIERQDFRAFLSLILDRHIFPEIHICRTSIIKNLYRIASENAYWAFVQNSVILNNSSICFWSKPFYKFVLRYWPDKPHKHAGNEEAKVAWDRYRGGLQYILSYFSNQLATEERRQWLDAIEQFTMVRMAVALRLRTIDQQDWIESYFLANRLLASGLKNHLAISFNLYRINAAFEYLIALAPFAPKKSQLAYLTSEPPKTLIQAAQFSSTPWNVVDRMDQIPDFSILLTDRNIPRDQEKIMAISETKLLAMFP